MPALARALVGLQLLELAADDAVVGLDLQRLLEIGDGGGVVELAGVGEGDFRVGGGGAGKNLRLTWSRAMESLGRTWVTARATPMRVSSPKS